MCYSTMIQKPMMIVIQQQNVTHNEQTLDRNLKEPDKISACVGVINPHTFSSIFAQAFLSSWCR